MSATSLVSVVIPCFNRANLLGATLDSVLKQTHSEWEAIVVDDGSNDASLECAASFARRDSRVCAISRPSDRVPGANSCRNYGLSMAQGQYVIFLDSDDLLVAEKIARQSTVLDRNPELVASITQAVRFKRSPDDPTEFWKPGIGDRLLVDELAIFRKIGWQTAAPMWRREHLDDKAFDEELHAAQEWLFHVHQAAKFPRTRFHFDESFTVLVRTNTPSISRARDSTRYYDYLLARKKALELRKPTGQPALSKHAVSAIVRQKRKWAHALATDGSAKSDALLKAFRNTLWRHSPLSALKFSVGLWVFRRTGRGWRLL